MGESEIVKLLSATATLVRFPGRREEIEARWQPLTKFVSRGNGKTASRGGAKLDPQWPHDEVRWRPVLDLPCQLTVDFRCPVQSGDFLALGQVRWWAPTGEWRVTSRCALMER